MHFCLFPSLFILFNWNFYLFLVRTRFFLYCQVKEDELEKQVTAIVNGEQQDGDKNPSVPLNKKLGRAQLIKSEQRLVLVSNGGY